MGKPQKFKNLNKADRNKLKSEEAGFYCYCWDMPTFKVAPKYDLCISPYKFIDLGVGLPLYFYFKLFTIIVFAVWTLMVAIPTMIINSQGDGLSNTNNWNKNADESLFIEVSLGNHGPKDNDYNFQAPFLAIFLLNTLFMIIFFILTIWYTIFREKAKAKFDENLITPSDFTVLAYNIPLHISPVDLKEWLSTNHEVKDIKSITYWYDIKQMIGKFKQ